MNHSQTNPVQKSEVQRLAWTAARVVFLVYLFFIFFGTGLPFRPEIIDVDEKTTSNAVNRIVFSSVFLVSCLCLCARWRSVLQFIRREKYLSLFLAWCMLSMSWSEFSGTTFKRSFQLVTCAAVSLTALLHCGSSGELHKLFETILCIYLPLSLLAVFFVPGAVDPKFMTWRGLAPSKNHLGQVCVVSALVWFHSVCTARRSRRTFALLMLGASLLLLTGSRSLTSAITLCCVTALFTALYVYRRIMPPSIARPFVIAAAVVLIGITLAGLLGSENGIAAAAERFGKDSTFSGRTDLWQQVWAQATQHAVLGAGLGGFWVIDNPEVLILYEEFVWLPNQAHMGFLDVFNETGAVGLLILAAMVLSYFNSLRKIKVPYYLHWFVVAALIINLQETTLFRPNFLTGVMFMFAYMALHTDLMLQESQVSRTIPAADSLCILPKPAGAGISQVLAENYN